jgi:hypothetical protein
MIFYFNRDATAGGEEFQTFMDEWSTHDYPGERRGVDSAAGVGIMPTDSYMDFALYWYAKSFDVAGNTGVYMDNLYFRPFANTLMSGAFRREDGSLAPSNGIWELREQAKRTFTFMCERGMEPIHMAHMTSLELLPILAFYTVQYDWEWQRGRGDVHDRFSREYLQLVSLGEAAGAWPIVLHELGRHEESLFSRYDYAEVKKILETYNGQASDPRVLRTFLGVTLVHELLVDPYFWHYEPIREGDTPENRLFETFRRPVLDFVQKPGVDVYRYWDARPQPASTNDPALPTIVFVRKGQEALCVVTNFAAEPRSADLRIDAAALGFDGGFRMIDLETGGEVPAAAGSAPVAIGGHDLREFRILPA